MFFWKTPSANVYVLLKTVLYSNLFDFRSQILRTDMFIDILSRQFLVSASIDFFDFVDQQFFHCDIDTLKFHSPKLSYFTAVNSFPWGLAHPFVTVCVWVKFLPGKILLQTENDIHLLLCIATPHFRWTVYINNQHKFLHMHTVILGCKSRTVWQK